MQRRLRLKSRQSIDDASPQEWDEAARASRTQVGQLYYPRTNSDRNTPFEGDEFVKPLDPADDAKSAGAQFHSFDPVSKPRHYNLGGVECIDAIKAALGDEFKSYLQGSVMKYIWRYEHKGKGLEDLRKAQWYLCRLIEEVQKHG